MTSIDIKTKQDIVYKLQKRVKRQKLTIKALVILFALLILAGLWFYAYKRTEGWWMKNLIVSMSPHAHKALAKELTLEEYICTKNWDCKTALAVATAENGTHVCDRVNINKNNTLDLGYFQINTVHLKKGWKLSDLLDCRKNIDYAYEIWKGQGWTPWVTYTTGKFKKYL